MNLNRVVVFLVVILVVQAYWCDKALSAEEYILGLEAEFFDIGTSLAVIPDMTVLTPDVTRIDTRINYASTSGYWSGLSFDDYYASRHTGFVKIDTAGDYTFYLNSDDGSKMWLDSAEFIDNDGLHGMLEESSTETLGVGYHSIRVEFFENGGAAGLILSWQGPGISKQVVPASALYHGGPPDTTPPTPDPLTWETVPYAVDDTWLPGRKVPGEMKTFPGHCKI